MYLKKYQIRVVNELKHFFQTAKTQKTAIETAAKALPESMRNNLNYVQSTFDTIKKPYADSCRNGLGHYYPRTTLKVPTGGGKTILAVEAIREYQTLFAERKTGLVVWIVPKETIYSQTVDRLRDKSHPYRQLLDQASGGKTIIKEKGQKLSRQDIEENLVVLFVMIQSISRANNKEALKVFQDSGGYDSFFPQDNRYDLHGQWLKEVPNLDTMWTNGDQAQLVTSLGNAVRVSKPFIIIDEIHRVFTATAKATIDNLNPELVLGLSATPKEGMNILSTVTGLELKDEEMVKLDLHIRPPANASDNDWKGMISQIKEHRETLENKAIEYRQNTGEYIRPIALIQVERTGKDQRGKGFVHSEDVKEHLIEMGVNPDEVAIKSSSQNDIENINLFSPDCPIRFIITKEALTEGWDCSFAYTLGIIPNTASNTGVTQLIGRILRQPRAKKTGVAELDESYVYYCKGDTRSLLDRVITGFKEEGLEDLVSKMKVQGQDTVNPTKKVKIKDEFKKFEYAFYLPVWLMVNKKNKSKRRFSYDFDVSPFIDFHSYSISDELLEKITSSLSDENKEQKAFTVTINDQSETAIAEEALESKFKGFISKGYMTRRFSEVIDNSFLARKVCNDAVDKLMESVGEQKLSEHFSYITSLITKDLKALRNKQEEDIFLQHLKEDRLELAVSDDKSIGYKIPTTDTITTTSIPNTYSKNLYSDVEVTTMNGLEKSVASILENQEKLLWWFRNRVGKDWYAIQGWHEHKIRPDFVAAKKKDDDTVEVIYIIESKGEHLSGNPDTTYKKKVMDEMTRLKKDGKLVAYQTEFDFGTLNESVEAYLIEEKKEEEELKRLMK
jgi:type III restriction enzyme